MTDLDSSQGEVKLLCNTGKVKHKLQERPQDFEDTRIVGCLSRKGVDTGCWWLRRGAARSELKGDVI